MDVKIGIFAVPDATDAASTIEQIIAADRSGLDIVGVQDHPYQWRFFDTWTLLAHAAGRTERVRLVPDVLNLPLRLPSLLAKSVASLDVLSGGRVDVGIGAGAFWDAVEAMGGPRRTPRESVDALEEALMILRGFWSGERIGAVRGPALPSHGRASWSTARPPSRNLARRLRAANAEADGPAGRRLAAKSRRPLPEPR
jgi:alkanesulfonate monooxygenase SsuD/methylene tetrahydromethanopterin reductase-like flavin-dependent oxidoreductase (luciferase family)